MSNLKNYYIFFVDFFKKNLNIISFGSIFFAGVFFYVNILFENQSKNNALLQKSINALNVLVDKQVVLLLEQQNQINSLKLLNLEDSSVQNGLNIWLCVAGGVSFFLVVGAVIVFYSTPNKPESGPSSNPDSSDQITLCIQKNLKPLIRFVREETSNTLCAVEGSVREIESISNKNFTDLNKVFEVMIDGISAKMNQYISNITVNVDTLGVSNEIIKKLNVNNKAFLTNIKLEIKRDYADFLNNFQIKNDAILAHNNELVNTLITQCNKSNSKLEESVFENSSNIKDSSLDLAVIGDNSDFTAKVSGLCDLIADSVI
jgi:hypothetical protein